MEIPLPNQRESGKKRRSLWKPRKPVRKSSSYALFDSIPFLWSLSVFPVDLFYNVWSPHLGSSNVTYVGHLGLICLVVSLQLAWIRLISGKEEHSRFSVAFMGLRAGWVIGLTVGGLWIFLAVLDRYDLWLKSDPPRPVLIRASVIYSLLVLPFAVAGCSVFCLLWERLLKWSHLPSLWHLNEDTKWVRISKRAARYALIAAVLLFAGRAAYLYSASKGWNERIVSQFREFTAKNEQPIDPIVEPEIGFSPAQSETVVNQEASEVQVSKPITPSDPFPPYTLDPEEEAARERDMLQAISEGRDPLRPMASVQREITGFLERHLNRLRSGQIDGFLNDFVELEDPELITAQPLTRVEALEFLRNLSEEERENFPVPSNMELLQTNYTRPAYSVILQYGEPRKTPSGNAWDDATMLDITLQNDIFRIYGGHYGKLHRKAR